MSTVDLLSMETKKEPLMTFRIPKTCSNRLTAYISIVVILLFNAQQLGDVLIIVKHKYKNLA